MRNGIKKFITGTGGVATCGLIAKVIGAFYRVPLFSVLGVEGMGLYQLAFPLFSIVLTLSSGGVTVAVAKAVGEKKNSVVKCAVKNYLPIALCLTIVLATLSTVVAKLQGNVKARGVYLFLCPSIIIGTLSAIFRGYFQGRLKIALVGVGNLIEQVFKLGFGLALAYILSPLGADKSAVGAAFGVTVSNALTLIFFVIAFSVTAKHQPQSNANYDVAELRKKLFRLGLGTLIGSIVMPVSSFIDSIVIINVLSRTVSVQQATALYGLLSVVTTLLNAPSAITSAPCVALLPEASALYSNSSTAQKVIIKRLKQSLILGFISAVILFFSPSVLKIVYPTFTDMQQSLVASALRIGAISTVYVSCMQVFSATMQARDMATLGSVSLLIGATLKLTLTPFAISSLSIVGAVVCSTVCYIVTVLLQIAFLLRRNAEKRVISKRLLKKSI